MNTNVLGAVFKRNFFSYFANPTGYVFICVFVLLSTVAAFWPNEFFNNNLANLDQLNGVFPFIMLVFIPAITMAVWADERRQGTDELLLTIPAADSDVVLGKYLAAVTIYTVSLLVSLVSNWAVLRMLGSPDPGLFLGTYTGYWLLGLAMLALGMVASFLTSNLTVAYILGAVFNVPLVFAAQAEVILPTDLARTIRQWSIGEQFYDFGRGVITLAGTAYFLAIVAVMLYLSVLLIGRRHWVGDRQGPPMVLHYTVRTLALIVGSIGLVALLHARDFLRVDVTSERLSSLSGETVKLLRDLKFERPVKIEAFISPKVPESYVQTRLNLLSMLRELEARGGSKVSVLINPTERYSEEALRAEKRYGITARQVPAENRGAMSIEHIFMGVAFTSGLQKVILPFIDRGIPVEYELVRSLCTVAEQSRKRVGVLQTDAKLYGEFNFQAMSSSQNWPIIDELEKQYTVVKVDPANAISDRYDVLLAVQPSSLGPEQMEHFLDAVKGGQPTLIFEDPFPIFTPDVPATSAPRTPGGGMNPMMMMMGGQQNQQPKGDIGRLWNLLGVDFTADQIVWQKYNPYRKAQQFPPEFVFVDEGSGAREPFNEAAPVTSGLQHMLFPFPGAINRLQAAGLQFEPLVRTGTKTGTVRYFDIFQSGPFGGRSINEMRNLLSTHDSYVLAARIHGKIKADQPMAAEDDKPAAEKPAEPEKPKETEINVILVTDIDCLSRDFFRLREQGEVREAGINFDFDNVTFVLNALDQLAGDNRFLEIRKRRPAHRTLSEIDKKTEAAQREAADARERFMKEFEENERKERKALEDKVAELQKKEGIDPQQLLIEVAMAKQAGERRLSASLEQDRQERDKKINEAERKLTLEVRKVQDSYKMWAVLLPPVPPLLVAVGVFLTRRSREREGVARSRLRRDNKQMTETGTQQGGQATTAIVYGRLPTELQPIIPGVIADERE